MKKFFMNSCMAAVLVSGAVLVSCGSTKVTAPSSVSSLSDLWITSTKDNSQYCGKFYTTPEMGKYKSLEVEFKKDSGCEDSCFGLVFGYTSQNNGICADYLRFEINTLGEYAVYSYDGKNYKDCINDDAENTAYLTESSLISTGFGAQNKLKISYDENNKTYSCYINGSCVASNVPALENGTKGVMAFFSVGQESQEKLPDTPVEVSYRITAFER